MSDFHWGLVALGVAVVLGMQLHGVWMTRRGAPRQAEPEAPRPPPAMPPPGDAAHGEPEPEQAAAEALLEDTTRFMVPELPRRPAMDALIDVIATLEPESPDAVWSGEAVLAAFPPTSRVGSKPFAVEGFNVATAAWEVPAAGARYSALQAGVQLANRMGALSEIEFSDFVVKPRRWPISWTR